MTGTFRLAHISDTHLGYRAMGKPDPETGRNQRTVDVERAFTRLIDDLIARRVDGVIHSGDVFHHSRPTWQSLRHFIRQMRRLEQAGIPTLVIAGNHDTPRVRSGGSAFSVLELALPETRFVTEFEDVPFVDTFAVGDLLVHSIPHGALTNPDPVSPRLVPGKRNVLVTHGMVPGVIPAAFTVEPGEQMLDNRLLDEGFDYIALGHVHQAQQVAPNAWYAGCSERFGWNDMVATPCYNLVEFGVPGEPVRVTCVETVARRMIPLQPIRGEGKDARDIVDAIIAQLDSLAEPDAMTRVELRDVARPVRREVQSLIRREVGQRVWHLDIAAERSTFTPQAVSESEIDAPLDLHALFAEFVGLRRSNYPSDAFATMFLERGASALTDAMLAEENPAPEEDSVT